MWCIPKITQKYIERMNSILDLYELPYDPCESIVGLDEKSKQLLSHSRMPIPLTSNHGIREDSEYIRKGTCNLFVAVEPKGNKRYVKVTSHRTKKDFAFLVKELVENEYNKSRKLHLVVDNLNTHFEKSFYETFKHDEADRILGKIALHYTPKHGSWLNVAVLESRDIYPKNIQFVALHRLNKIVSEVPEKFDEEMLNLPLSRRTKALFA